MSEQPNECASAPNFEFDALRAAENYRRALIREFTPHLQGRVLEIGAGIGQITELLRKVPAIQYLLSIEPDAAFCREFRQNFPDQPLIEGTVDSLTDHQAWHAIVSINVLEHIQEDERELAAYARLLRAEKGRLCLFVPARQEIYSPIDHDFGHRRRYSKAGLGQKLTQAGFEVVRLNYFNSVGYLAWWVNFCVLRKRSFHVGSVRFFDRMVFPCVHWCESRICPPPIGQSLIAVAQAR
jgi:SAM-dependent methyltransferase